MKKLTFVVAIDRYDYGSGGNNIMHILAQKIRDLGEEVYTFGSIKPNSTYKTLKIKNYDPSKSTLNDIKSELEIIDNLDPETTVFICWNTFNSNWVKKYGKIARWCVYYDYDLNYEEHDLIFFQQEGYNIRNKDGDGLLNIFDIDYKYWESSNQPKTHNTFLYRKAIWNIPNLPEHAESVLKKVYEFNQKPFLNIDNLAGVGLAILDDEDNIKLQLKKIYQQTDYFICFDDITAHSLFAALCGAKSIVIPGYLKVDKEGYRKEFDFFKCGVAYGLDDLDHMMDTKDKLRNHLQSIEDQTTKDVSNFVDKCYQKFTI